MDECRFHIEILAPAGLSGIEPHLQACELPLRAYRSGFNGHVLLRQAGGADAFEFDMQPSTTEVVHATGSIFSEQACAWRMIESLSRALRRAGFAHWARMDRARGAGLYRQVAYRYPDPHAPSTDED